MLPRPGPTRPSCCRISTYTLTSTLILATATAYAPKTCVPGLEHWPRLWRHFRRRRLQLPLPLLSGLQRPASATTALSRIRRRHQPYWTATLSLEPSPAPSTASSTNLRTSPTFLFHSPSPTRRSRLSPPHPPSCPQHHRRGDDRGDRPSRPRPSTTRLPLPLPPRPQQAPRMATSARGSCRSVPTQTSTS